MTAEPCAAKEQSSEAALGSNGAVHGRPVGPEDQSGHPGRQGGLQTQGKAPNLVLVAYMRKLLIIFNTMLKNNTPWVPKFA